MLLDPGKLAAALPTDVQEQVALLEGVVSHAEEGNPARHQFIAEIAISAKWFLHIIHVILFFFPSKEIMFLCVKSCSFSRSLTTISRSAQFLFGEVILPVHRKTSRTPGVS